MVAALLWIQFERVGIDETPWIVGVLIVTGLLVLAFSPSKSARMRQAARSTQHIHPNKAIVAAFAVVETEFIRVWDVTSETMETNATLVMLEENIRLQAAKLAWIAVLFALEREHPGFRQSARFEEVSLLGGVEFRKHFRHFIKNTSGPNAGTKSRELAAKAAAECTFAFDKSYALNATKQPLPMTPVFSMIEKTFPFSNSLKSATYSEGARLEAAYGPVLRKAMLAASEAR